MRILILSANTGGGHNSTAAALGEQLEKLGAEHQTADTLSFISEKVSKFISWGHTYLYRKLPLLFGWGYRYEEKHPPKFIYEQCNKGVDSLYQFLLEGKFDAVICVHVFSSMMMTGVREKYEYNIPSFFVSTDYTCHPGVSESKMDGFFIPHAMLCGEFVRSGVKADKMHPTGIPVRHEFYLQMDKTEAREKLGLPLDQKVLVVSFGSMGCGQLEKHATYLAEHLGEDICIVVLCGTNQKTYETLLPRANERFRVISFTKEMAVYMSAADAYITKPGGLTTTEAIAKRLPMLLMDAVPGCETRNFQFLTSMGVARGAKNWKQLTELANELLTKEGALAEQAAKMEGFSKGIAAEEICKYVVGHRK
ncbi:MAG: hypothetical protein IKB75_02415 [Clostridia bacterium]|nr:hypothetical protein [Clostridia bacterium]